MISWFSAALLAVVSIVCVLSFEALSLSFCSQTARSLATVPLISLTTDLTEDLSSKQTDPCQALDAVFLPEEA